MAYVYDYINNTLIDDEDKSLGNKLGLMDGGRVNFENGSDNPFINIEDLNKKLQKANINRKTESIDFYINKFGKETLDKIAQDKHGKNFSELEGDNLNNLKRRLDKYENFVKQNNRMPTESEARKFGRIDRDKTITGTGTKEITEEDIRKKLIKNNKPAETFKKKIIFADKNIQNEFEAELRKRYSFPRTSAAAEAAGVLNNQQIYEKFLKPAGYGFDSTRTIVNDYKKFLDVDFQELSTEQKEAKKVEREKLEKISQGGKRISGTVDNPAHHMFPLGDQIGAKTGEFTVIPKSINGKIAYANKQMKKLVLERGKILDKVKIDQTVNIKDLDKQLADINNKAEEVIKNHYKKYPSHEGLLNWKKIDFVLDDVGRLLNVNQVGTIGGDYKKWTLANIDKTILDKKVANLSKEELAEFRKIIEETSVARDAGNKSFGAKDSTPIKNLFTSLKDKLDTSRMFTSRIPGGAIALTPLDFILSYGSGMPLLESAASAGSYLIKDPLVGKAVNIPLNILQDMQDPEATFKKAGERKEKIENFLDDLTGTDSDKPFAPQLIEKLSNMKAGDQPDIDPFQAAKGGRAKLNKGGGVDITPLPRANFGNGGAAGADENFATELEYFFMNPNTEIPEISTYKETSNPIEIFNNIIDPRNYPYYADMLLRSGLRIGEFGVRVLPATGKLIADALQKGVFKIRDNPDSKYIQDYDEILPSNIKGTGIFSEFLQNITPTTLEKKVGLDKLIKAEEKKQIERGSTAGPKVFAETLGLGAEIAAPIFPGVKLLKAFAKNRNLPVNNVTKKLLIKEVDEVLEQRGMDRREFLKVTGAGSTVILAKLLGFGDEIAKTTKVAEKVAEKATGSGVPPYFFQLVEKIRRNGKQLEPEFDPRVENNMQFENFVMKENMTTGEITIQKTKEGGFNTGEDVIEGTISDELITYKPGDTVLGKDGKYYRTADEYEEITAKPDNEGKMKDIEEGLDSIEEIIELLPNKLKMSELEAAGYNVDAFPDNIKRLLIDDLQKTN